MEMPGLAEAMRVLDVDGELSLSGHVLALRGAGCRVYVAEAPYGRGYFAWCDHPDERRVERYADAIEAIEDGLRRADRLGAGRDDGA